MARILPQGSVAEFLTAYKVTEFGTACPPDSLTVKVWDLYGTKPENETTAPGIGSFIAAVVICEPCSRHITLNRRRLGG
jgi:hypothetical protein